GIDAEVIDLRTIKPWDKETVFASLRRTGRLIVVDAAWATCGVSADIAACAAGEAFETLKAPIVRVTLPDLPAPTSVPLEKAYYVKVDDVVAAAERLLVTEA
ncbi:MAG: hypothetical protein HYZ74_05950, partial [Elusimicrobia bacterium]|nr:hypothetical protein [Elusimicrobiota bacterium]